MTREQATEIVTAVLSAHKRLKLGTPIIVNGSSALVRVLSDVKYTSLGEWFADAGASVMLIDTTFDEWSVQFKLPDAPRKVSRS